MYTRHGKDSLKEGSGTRKLRLAHQRSFSDDRKMYNQGARLLGNVHTRTAVATRYNDRVTFRDC